MSPKMRALMIAEVGPELVDAFRSSAVTPELMEWADLCIGFQSSHYDALETHPVERRWASIGRWRPHADACATRSCIGGQGLEFLPCDCGATKGIKDPHFDSTGALHAAALRILKETLPALHLEVVG